MDIDRVLVKSQARQIIKKQILGLFLITLVVSLLCGFGTAAENVYSYKTDDSYSDIFGGSYFDDFYNQNDGSSSNNGGSYDKGYFDNFTGKINLIRLGISDSYVTLMLDVGEWVSFFMLPLTVTLCGLYLVIVRGEQMNTGGYFNYVFKNTFDKSYWRKLWCAFLQQLIILFMFLLLIVPGIIFYYKYYFASTIMADNPNLKATDAIKISKKITKGHKSELFRLDLSFLGWFILTIITCGILSIYTAPYYMTTKALYYENFRIRALQEGKVTALDFMSEEEKVNFYQQNQQANTYYQPPQNDSNINNYDYYNNNF